MTAADDDLQQAPLRADDEATTPASTTWRTSEASVLDRGLNISTLSWWSVLLLGVILTALVLRFAALNTYALSAREASWAYHAFALFRGQPLPGGDEIPTTAPLFLILEGFAFFLFGVTDAVARVVPALLGIGIIGLIFTLRPLMSTPKLVGMALMAALSPTLVFASRTADPVIAVAFCSLLLV
ncbi:MAG: hypothetical protein M3121_07345, partial [Chloroflexota bacterium]|nr:hypothetical protein [Chloroflexota bacterium]